ncbi:MAG: pseudaminic acid cytidylyltransferase [Betaproteobacteria bacterium]
MKIAVIPARGGSKRIPRKNIKVFDGLPMIAYAIRAALETDIFSNVVVSTDDEEISEVARSYGASVPFMRPKELANDHTVTVPVIGHAVSWFNNEGYTLEAACCIYPCVPFIKSTDLTDAYQLFTEKNADYVYPVVGFHSSPWRAMTRPENGPMKFIFPENELTRTQDLPLCYQDAGMFYWGKASSWVNGLRMHSNGYGYIMSGSDIVDIDNEEDWTRAERIAQLK